VIALFSLLASGVLKRRELDAARRLLTGGDLFRARSAPGAGALPWRKRLGSISGWADAASYTLADAKMLRKEMAIGYLVAGFLAVLVPTSVWSDVFLSGTESRPRSRTWSWDR